MGRNLDIIQPILRVKLSQNFPPTLNFGMYLLWVKKPTPILPIQKLPFVSTERYSSFYEKMLSNSAIWWRRNAVAILLNALATPSCGQDVNYQKGIKLCPTFLGCADEEGYLYGCMFRRHWDPIETAICGCLRLESKERSLNVWRHGHFFIFFISSRKLSWTSC